MKGESKSDAWRRRRDEEDAAVVLAMLAGLSAPPAPVSAPSTFWGSPAFALGPVGSQGRDAWWASGLPR
ncbi:acyl-CoA carboxylase subunit epsilon [Nakamurella sp. PAMC28650]|uniref:acyl-CoA carboxylase subunit epsilon n=1 Tax=Nakamurella sp. PAMC28650 TaxID=2762325 RepID=UPI00164D7F05|nr:acyl-CoA carboxylase subunit epsilon [Nakamurella sp. PAMC28650]QNK80603.1 acyl-CoA carboxylase subunit epsilon [Nakamurella sp. PAMC28650]